MKAVEDVSKETIADFIRENAKRGVMGTFHNISAKYLPLYLNESSFRYNNRSEFDMMDKVLQTSF